MREILFRGKRNNGIWEEGSYIVSCEKHYIYDGIYYEVIPETIGQYTGLRDNTRTKEYPDGKRIFEGDIVDILTENEEIGVIAYEDGGFLVNADGFSVDFHSNIYGTDLEIIGNIHDNPELLKGGAE